MQKTFKQDKVSMFKKSIMNQINYFSDIKESMYPYLGGKGRSLAILTKQNFPVPLGFVIPCTVFDNFINDELKEKISSLTDEIDMNNPTDLLNSSTIVRDLIIKTEFPVCLEALILEKALTLKSDYVAVRSSATLEDSVETSWAGLLESYLYTPKGKIIQNIKKCWSSLYTPRAIAYRRNLSLHNQSLSVAVIVQKMVDSEVAGVCFTVHPVTGDKNIMIIEAGYGVGESVVKGTITPDTYLVNKQKLKIISTTVSKQLFRVGKGLDGVQKFDVPKLLHTKQKLIIIDAR